uniref:Major facilitator superfamily (MFS) profile domain-containing protein n=1 Tax=Aplanochytrium stocchinoi TaxID=215587 RepID=A0A6S8B5I9_9STRA|mmetsp:Transcript_4611/g.5321  ORF Transcript_4611/g.5321 Transcript_4611/m.5321 type:complete len:529 (-) Transcript_4611:31-1617(-)|eukprot:CAMPEP_0204826620 /NCGR_PEP_ID=MMETSP1346-20131115/4266_1 /ASSEMBLY_ACC=CAM_ASM_000771 /TAXON_ID=215587 /ORGANISM="Aplanochytrium stocchinoi, Strain GSBS06" /LENGTH=528 /DNA_ID=CAMNT_0051954715 /DNA_START=278 /DNA_END=1864 /DNA_ORIENTATION=+
MPNNSNLSETEVDSASNSASHSTSFPESQSAYSYAEHSADACIVAGAEDYTGSFVALCLIGFLDAVEYGSVMPSLYGYIEQLNKGTGISDDSLSHQYGLILSVFSAASLLSKPLLGYLGDRRPFVETFLWTTLVAIAGNLLYFLTAFLVEDVAGNGNSSAFWLLLTSRILSGVGCANTALTFAFVARTVTPEQRTKKMSLLSLVKVSGLAMGPGFNAITARIDVTLGQLKIDEYNSPGLLVAIFQAVIILIVVLVLKEPPAYAKSNDESTSTTVADSNDERNGESSDTFSSTYTSHEVKVSMTTPLLLCFLNILCFNFFFGTLEATTTPVTQTAFDWSPLQISYVFMILTLIAVSLSIVVIVLSKCVEDRVFLLIACIFAIIGPMFARFTYFYNMSIPTFITGIIAWAVPASLAFASNRSLFSRLIEGSHQQGFYSSLLSVLASLGGIIGPNWVGLTIGSKPNENEDKHVRVAPVMYTGILVVSVIVLVANVMVLFIIPTEQPILAHASKNTEQDELEEGLLCETNDE